MMDRHSLGRVLYWLLPVHKKKKTRANNLNFGRIRSTRLMSAQTLACQFRFQQIVVRCATLPYWHLGPLQAGPTLLRSVPNLGHDLGFRRRLPAIPSWLGKEKHEISGNVRSIKRRNTFTSAGSPSDHATSPLFPIRLFVRIPLSAVGYTLIRNVTKERVGEPNPNLFGIEWIPCPSER